MNDASRGKRVPPPMTTEQRERLLLKESLESTKRRVIADLERATHPRHRKQLEEGLAHLDSELTKLT